MNDHDAPVPPSKSESANDNSGAAIKPTESTTATIKPSESTAKGLDAQTEKPEKINTSARDNQAVGGSGSETSNNGTDSGTRDNMIEGGTFNSSSIGAGIHNNYENNYNYYNKPDKEQEEKDPTIPIPLNRIARDASHPQPQQDIDRLRERLLSKRVQFLAFDSPQRDQQESLINQLLHDMGNQYDFRQAREAQPLKFSMFLYCSKLFEYKRATVVILSPKAMALLDNADFINNLNLIPHLQEKIDALKVFLIVPAPRGDVLIDDYDGMLAKKSEYVWRIAPPPVTNLQVTAPPKLNKDDLIGNIVQFIFVFFDGLTQRELYIAVETLLKRQQSDTPSRARTTIKGSRFAERPSDLLNQWHLSSDNILADNGIVYRKSELNSAYAFSDQQRADMLRKTFFETARNWSAQQFDALLDILLGARRVSELFQQQMVKLLLDLHENQIVLVDADWLSDIFSSRVKMSISESAFPQFQRMLYCLLTSTECREQAMRFLKTLPRLCRQRASDWTENFLQLDSVQHYVAMGANLSLDELKYVQRSIGANLDVFLNKDTFAPLDELRQMHALIILEMKDRKSIPNIVSIILDALTETPQQFNLSCRFAKFSALLEVSRPSAAGIFLGLVQYFGGSCDMLYDFGRVVADTCQEAGDNPNFAMRLGLTVLLDALHVGVSEMAERYANDKDANAGAFIDRYFGIDGDFAAILAKTNALRSPPVWGKILMPDDDPPLRCSDLRATTNWYRELAVAIAKIEKEDVDRKRGRIQALIKPFALTLPLRQRGQLRDLLRGDDAYYVRRRRHFDQSKNSTEAQHALRRVEVIRFMLAALP